MANESGMREHVRVERWERLGVGVGAVSGQASSRQGGKRSEVFVHVCVLLLFFRYRGICRSVCCYGTRAINCREVKAKFELTESLA